MTNPRTPTAVTTLFSTLHERAKELSCLYRIEEILSIYDVPLEEVFRQVIEAIPPGWQYPECCQAQITYGAGRLRIPRIRGDPLRPLRRDPGPGRLGRPSLRVLQEADPGERLRSVHEGRDQAHPDDRRAPRALHPPPAPAGHVRGDQRRAARRGRREAGLADRPGPPPQHQSEPAHPGLAQDDELPRLARRRRGPRPPPALQRRRDGRRHVRRIQPAPDPGIHGPLLRADRGDLPDRLGQPDRRGGPRPHPEVDQRGPLELGRSRTWRTSTPTWPRSSTACAGSRSWPPRASSCRGRLANSVRVALIRRFFTEQLEFINVAKKYVDIEDFFDLMERIIFPPGSHGKLGGKSAGLFLASRILQAGGPARRRSSARSRSPRPGTSRPTA